jgi:hypothetical protein
MRIAVNHVTRMALPRVCVAGIALETFEHVRPTTPSSDTLTRELLREEGGPFGMGAIVELGPTAPCPSPPEVEDRRFRPASARRIEDMHSEEFLSLLERISAPDLESAFGPALERVGWRYAVEAGHGDRSLAVIETSGRPILAVDEQFGKLQLRLDDVEPPCYIPVTDIRFYGDDQKTIKTSAVENVRVRLRRGVDVFLMLGLARAYKASGDDRERHWLQVNGLCLVDRPVADVP